MLDFDEGRPNGWKERGNLIPMMQDANRGSPKTLRQEVMGIVGFGSIGEYILITYSPKNTLTINFSRCSIMKAY
jgi:phosphoglycerate dehydrogenase-like enzyme